MKDLLTAIKSRLQTDTTLDYVRDCDIFIASAENTIPLNSLKFPAIGIKDGVIRNENKLCKNYLQWAQVHIIGWVQVLKVEDSIMGNNSQKGLLDLMGDIFTSLIDNRLGYISGDGQIMSAFPINESASNYWNDESLMVQWKIITFEYIRKKSWA